MLTIDDLAKEAALSARQKVQEPEDFDGLPPCEVEIWRSIGLAVARAVLTEAATVAWNPQPGEIYAPCLAHGHGSCGAQCHRTAHDMIRTILAQLEKGAAK